MKSNSEVASLLGRCRNMYGCFGSEAGSTATSDGDPYPCINMGALLGASSCTAIFRWHVEQLAYHSATYVVRGYDADCFAVALGYVTVCPSTPGASLPIHGSPTTTHPYGCEAM